MNRRSTRAARWLTALLSCVLLLTTPGAGAWAAQPGDGPGLAATVPVDGTIEAGYGTALATDPAGDISEANLDLQELYVTDDANNYYLALKVGALGNYGMEYHIALFTDTVAASGAPADAYGRNFTFDNGTASFQPPYSLKIERSGDDGTIAKAELTTWDGNAWQYPTLASLGGATASDAINGVVEVSIPKTALGSPTRIYLMAVTSGGCCKAQDSVPSDPDVTNKEPNFDGAVVSRLSALVGYGPGAAIRPMLALTSPASGSTPDANVTVAGSVTPPTSVVEIVTGSTVYTPTVGANGAFSQPLTLDPGTTTIVARTMDATSGLYAVERRTLLFGAAEGDDDVAFDGLYHDSRNTAYRYPFGATPISETVTLRLQTFANDVQSVQARLFRDTSGRPGGGETLLDMTKVVAGTPCLNATIAGATCDYWETTFNSGAKSTLFYRFIVIDGTRTVFYEDNTDGGGANIGDGGVGVAYDNSPDASFAINVYDPTGFDVLPWVRDGVWYQIFPDRFRNGDTTNDPENGDIRYDDPVITLPWGTLPEGYCRKYNVSDAECPWRFDDTPPAFSPTREEPRGRDYYGGDLRGVIDKLDYLQSMGVSILYFNPIFQAGSNHRYDTQDYLAIDEYLGDMDTFDELVTKAHERGMYIVLDGVFNHLSSDSPFFDRYKHYPNAIGACESPASPYRDWFYFRAPTGDQVATCEPTVPGGANTYYDGWFGFDSIPVLNKNRDSVRNYFYRNDDSVARYWLAKGIDGWRLDVASDGSFPEDYWREFRNVVKADNPNAVIVGEMWKKFEHLPFLQGDKMDGVQGYRVRDAVLGFIGQGASDNKGFPGEGQAQSASQFAAKLLSLREDYTDATLYSLINELGTHDTARIQWLLTPGEENRTDRELNAANVAIGKARQELAVLTLFTQPSPPGVYYGDEVGVTGDDDPDDRRTMPWADAVATGPFQLFLPFVPNNATAQAANAMRQQTDYGLSDAADRDLLAFYQLMGQTRTDRTVLRTGEMSVLLTDDANKVVAYSRTDDTDSAIVVLNASGTAQTVIVPTTAVVRDGLSYSNALAPDTATITTANGELMITLGAYSGALLLQAAGQDVTPPAAPTLEVAGRGDGEVSLTWNAPADATAYNLYRSRLQHGGYELVNDAPLTGTSFTDSGLVNGVPYYYVVAALDGLGNESAYSAEVTATPAFAIQFANIQFPATETFQLDAANSLTVYAQVFAENHTEAAGPDTAITAQIGYNLEGNPQTKWTWLDATYNVQAGDNDEYQATIQPRAAGTYRYIARFSSDGGQTWFYGDTDGSNQPNEATNGELGGSGDNAPGVLIVSPPSDSTAPAAPTNLAATNGGPSSVVLTWDANGESDLYAYNLYRSTTAGGPYTQVGGDIPAATTTYTDTGVSSNVAYYYVVRALDASFNQSAQSNETSATPAPRLVDITFNVTVDAASGITDSDTLYITGNPGDILCGFCDPQTIAFTKTSLTSWTATIQDVPEGAKLEYKYTLGTFNFVEKSDACGEIANRQVTASYGSDGTQVVSDDVPRWRNRAECPN